MPFNYSAELIRNLSGYKNYLAFTLAEVLITLGIIGVVAAMTLPALTTHFQKKQTVSQLKRTYSMLSQAVQLSEVSNGSHDDWDYTTLNQADFFTKYLKPYIKSIVQIKYSKIMNEIKYIRPNGTVENNFTPLDGTAMVVALADGSTLYLSTTPVTSTNASRSIFVDINGVKKPNIIGRDFFAFSIIPHKNLVPYGYGTSSDSPFGEMTRENVTKAGGYNYSCSRSGRGQFCAALIMIDGWEIKDDYPW